MLAAALRGVHDVGSEERPWPTLRRTTMSSSGFCDDDLYQREAAFRRAPDYQCCYRSDAGKDCGMAFTL